MVFNNLLNPVLGPLLKLPSLLAIVLLSFLISLIITLIQKYATDQNRMKQIKEEMKSFQNRMKEEKDPNEKIKLQKESMKLPMEQMKHSMKSMMYTFIPIILIFGWMSSHLAYDPILPGQDFTTTVVFEKGSSGEIELSVPEGLNIEDDAVKEVKGGEVKWVLNGDVGEYLLEYKFNNNKYTHEVLISDENEYKTPINNIKDGGISLVQIDYKKKIVLPLLGWGWLGSYIIFSIIFSMLLRKLMKVY